MSLEGSIANSNPNQRVESRSLLAHDEDGQEVILAMNHQPAPDESTWTGDLQPLIDVAAAHDRSISWWRRRRRLWRADHFSMPDGRQAVTSDFVEFALSIDSGVKEERRDRRLKSRKRKPHLKLVSIDGVQITATRQR